MIKLRFLLETPIAEPQVHFESKHGTRAYPQVLAQQAVK